MPTSSQVLDAIQVSFADERSVADAGLMLTGTLMGRLGLESTIDAIRQLDAVTEAALTRVRQAGAGPGSTPMLIDSYSTIGEVHGDAK